MNQYKELSFVDGSFLYSNLDLSNCLKKVVSLWVRLRAQDYGRVAFLRKKLRKNLS